MIMMLIMQIANKQLLRASKRGDEKSVKEMLEKGTDVLARERNKVINYYRYCRSSCTKLFCNAGMSIINSAVESIHPPVCNL